jgi:hypothetical protein
VNDVGQIYSDCDQKKIFKKRDRLKPTFGNLMVVQQSYFQNRIGKFLTEIAASCYGNSKDPSLIGMIAFALFI